MYHLRLMELWMWCDEFQVHVFVKNGVESFLRTQDRQVLSTNIKSEITDYRWEVMWQNVWYFKNRFVWHNPLATPIMLIVSSCTNFQFIFFEQISSGTWRDLPLSAFPRNRRINRKPSETFLTAQAMWSKRTPLNIFPKKNFIAFKLRISFNIFFNKISTLLCSCLKCQNTWKKFDLTIKNDTQAFDICELINKLILLEFGEY